MKTKIELKNLMNLIIKLNFVITHLYVHMKKERIKNQDSSINSKLTN